MVFLHLAAAIIGALACVHTFLSLPKSAAREEWYIDNNRLNRYDEFITLERKHRSWGWKLAVFNGLFAVGNLALAFTYL